MSTAPRIPETTATPAAPASERVRHVFRAQAADRDAWPRTCLGTQRRESGGAERLAGIALRGRGAPGTDAPIIGVLAIRDFRGEADARADHEAGGTDFSCPSDGEVVGSEVHAGGPDGEGHVEPIVEEYGDLDRREQRPAGGGELAGARPLQPQLHGGRAPGHGSPHGGDQVAGRQATRRRSRAGVSARTLDYPA
jgi:hypothetical protein